MLKKLLSYLNKNTTPIHPKTVHEARFTLFLIRAYLSGGPTQRARLEGLTLRQVTLAKAEAERLGCFAYFIQTN